MVHYIWTYLRIVEQHPSLFPNGIGDPTRKLDMIIPTGAMGNLAGGYMCKLMGIPINQFIAAVNINDIADRVIQTGSYYRSSIMHKTLSDAINIQLPYNFERLLFYLNYQKDNNEHEHEHYKVIQKIMTSVETKNGFDLVEKNCDTNNSNENNKEIKDDDQEMNIPNEDRLVLLSMFQQLQTDFNSCRVTDDEMCSTVRAIQKKYNYLCDPHTAVAFRAAIQLGYIHVNGTDTTKNDTTTSPSSTGSSSKKENGVVATAVLATASPCKFEESMTIAIGIEKWNEYRNNPELYPQSAVQIQSLTEKNPTQYTYNSNQTLKENQIQWEQMSYDIIKNKLQQQ